MKNSQELRLQEFNKQMDSLQQNFESEMAVQFIADTKHLTEWFLSKLDNEYAEQAKFVIEHYIDFLDDKIRC